jgi:riboflavin kinase/FMN adenylyltransferase
MSVFYDKIPNEFRGGVAALGNFDGVHAGHVSVVQTAKRLAEELKTFPAVAVFSPHPRRVFQPNGDPFALMSSAQRDRALLESGAEAVFHIRFDRSLSSMTPEAFIKEILVDQLGLAGVVTGVDFCFGKDRAGNAQTLKSIGANHNLTAVTADEISKLASTDKISSSDVRNALRTGQVDEAARLMGRPFAIEGIVTQGDQRGRTIGFPTANIYLGEYLRPALGVYATRSILENGQTISGVANLGRRPTVDGDDERLEVHLFDFEDDLYGQTLETQLLYFIRPERKFDSFDALKDQIAKDSNTARALLGVN